jgi:hypothetical protein
MDTAQKTALGIGVLALLVGGGSVIAVTQRKRHHRRREHEHHGGPHHTRGGPPSGPGPFHHFGKGAPPAPRAPAGKVVTKQLTPPGAGVLKSAPPGAGPKPAQKTTPIVNVRAPAPPTSKLAQGTGIVPPRPPAARS